MHPCFYLFPAQKFFDRHTLLSFDLHFFQRQNTTPAKAPINAQNSMRRSSLPRSFLSMSNLPVRKIKMLA